MRASAPAGYPSAHNRFLRLLQAVRRNKSDIHRGCCFPRTPLALARQTGSFSRSAELADILFSTAWRQKCIKLLSLHTSSGLKICRNDRPTVPLHLYDERQFPIQTVYNRQSGHPKDFVFPELAKSESPARGKVDQIWRVQIGR